MSSAGIIKLEVAGQETVDKAKKLLSGVPNGIDRAVKSAINRTATHVRANSTKAIQTRYAISAANIRSEENVKIGYRYGNGITATVVFYGKKIPLWRYDGTTPKWPSYAENLVHARVHGQWKTVHPGVTARAHQLRSTSPGRLGPTFVATMKSGHTGIFWRAGGSTRTGGDAIEELMGSSVPQMIGNEEVLQKISKEAAEKFEERLEHEVLRILNGWGG